MRRSDTVCMIDESVVSLCSEGIESPKNMSEQADRISEEFEAAVENSKCLAVRPDDNELLELYANYKQAMEGDNENSEPWRINVREHRKWEAWSSLEGTHPRDAAIAYARLVDKLAEKYGFS